VDAGGELKAERGWGEALLAGGATRRWLAPGMTPMVADDDAQAVAQANVAAMETTTTDNPVRELFEAGAYTRPLLSST